ncbi:hypothetical protein [Streptococcus marimammalium]|uniref:hypothetical protein n=1 Tax=Streptococcus marimammalium TaxID=269666 RepID=UPI00035FBAC3|nr:hypothetical protein [Streptococcus marimammalium]
MSKKFITWMISYIFTYIAYATLLYLLIFRMFNEDLRSGASAFFAGFFAFLTLWYYERKNKL